MKRCSKVKKKGVKKEEKKKIDNGLCAIVMLSWTALGGVLSAGKAGLTMGRDLSWVSGNTLLSSLTRTRPKQPAPPSLLLRSTSRLSSSLAIAIAHRSIHLYTEL